MRFTTTSHQGTVELGFPPVYKRKDFPSLCLGVLPDTTFPKGAELLPGAKRWLGQQNKGASIPEGAARLQENYLGPGFRGPLCFVSRSQQRRKREAWRGRDARQRESG